MAHSVRLRWLLSICAGFVLLSGCGRSQTQTNALVPSDITASSGSAGTLSWISGDAESRDLLYVSNHKDGSVSIYSYPQGKAAGSLARVYAAGLCAGSDGDVLILRGDEILKYAHAQARPYETLHNSPGGTTQFCAVNPATGDLAVSGGTDGSGGIAIYAAAKGNPAIYRQGDREDRYWSSAYDDKGNLFVEVSTGTSETAKLVELRNGGRRVRSVAWDGGPAPRLGNIQWDGRYLAVESPQTDSDSTVTLRYDVNRGKATLVGKTTVTGAGRRLQFWIHDPNVAAQIANDGRQPQAVAVSPAGHRKFAVTTYHYDNLRTGWNDKETVLTAQNVNPGSFGLLHTAALDDQVDTQPLIVPNERTTRGTQPGKHDVVYVATEGDTVYAIDASSGTILFHQNLGTPVQTPLGCNNNGPNVGIDGTPVIDRRANVMYVIAYTMQGSAPTYTIHELNLSDLSDAVAPVVVSASHQLASGYTFEFNATYQRQRPGLLEANGNIYAGFGSFCDLSANLSRGWLLGWQAGSLTPLAANRLNDTQPTSPDDFFLSSIWMSGYGVAADPAGNVYFVTGNSDYSGNTYNSVTNISETVAKVSSDLTQLLSFFTPADVGVLDEYDEDFGSGGVMLLPKSASKRAPLAAAAGKEGTLFLMNRKHLGGYHPGGPNKVYSSVNIGGCWCGPSYFNAASDGIPRIVGSGTDTVTVWRVPSSLKMTIAGYSQGLPSGQDPGFFTTVSSNGTAPGAIIWAVSRPQYVPGNVTLTALTAEVPSGSSYLARLYQAPAGSWISGGGNANLVPVVANGKVYVASYQQLDIFGLLGSNAKTASLPAVKAQALSIGAPHEVTGMLVAIDGRRLTLRTRTGATVYVDDSNAVAHARSVVLIAGRPVSARGTYDAAGVLHASSIVRAKPTQGTWPPDR